MTDGTPVGHRRRRTLSVILLGAILCPTNALAAPPTKDECIDANRQAQSLRRTGKLHAAQAALLVCVNPTCPAPVVDDCTSRLDEVQRVMPSLVFEVQDSAGKDVTKVTVTIDGMPFASTLDGTALPADPGEHTFAFEVAGQPPVTQQLVLHEGDKGRREHVVVGGGAPAIAPVVPAAAPAASQTEAASPGKGQRIAGLVAGGLGIVSLGLGAVLGVNASSSWSSSQNECSTPTNCPNHAGAVSDHDTALNDATFSTIGFIAGGVLVAGGVILFFTAPTREGGAAASTAMRVVPSVAPGAAAVSLQGTF
jgi:hypothetical protein